MDDLISRQAAIDALGERPMVWTDSDYEIAQRNQYDMDKLAIETVPSAQPAQQWIPCSERLPHTNGIYIVTRRISDGFECRNITDSCYFDGSNTWHDDTRVNHERKYLTDVVAWRELPEPWRGANE